jgi:hypothetical protein
MLSFPFYDETSRARCETPANHRQRIDIHNDLIGTVLGVKVWWIVIVLIHLDHNTVETAEFRHQQVP